MFKIKRVLSIFAATAFIFLIFGFQSTAAQDGTVLDIINESEDHTVMAELLEVSGVDEMISDDGPYTVIAPTDEAINSMELDVDKLREDPDMAHDFLVNHIFEGEVLAEDAGPSLDVNITIADIIAVNGIVHVTDEIIKDQ
ncbi:fasciclin domain-containing protein [Rhodohalobacter mucosus]|uniref:FAS1 domain-containing protein n=1 Tax=Rhodohalobacter mucosus TaxID=2079485 RepID=A0A316TTK9_9BACT|nr:fasciclin domain-containing protein [Rhodohalobacter mucosus]PWN07937.1 hypothetical protein DDZ15_02695 [Rhodohalobacter mucosus]